MPAQPGYRADKIVRKMVRTLGCQTLLRGGHQALLGMILNRIAGVSHVLPDRRCDPQLQSPILRITLVGRIVVRFNNDSVYLASHRAVAREHRVTARVQCEPRQQRLVRAGFATGSSASTSNAMT